jgi:hypothetical protein
MNHDEYKCYNENIVIVTLTDDLIEAKCTNCTQTGRAERKDYSPAKWADLVADAKKHQNGEYAE